VARLRRMRTAPARGWKVSNNLVLAAAATDYLAAVRHTHTVALD
jgi:hypothetical protein